MCDSLQPCALLLFLAVLQVPRMIVNIVQILPMQTLREVQKPTPGCLLQRSFCSCLIEPAAASPELQELVEVNLDFQVQFTSSSMHIEGDSSRCCTADVSSRTTSPSFFSRC